MMRRLTLGVRHSPIYYIILFPFIIYNIIPARIAPRADTGQPRRRLAGGPGSISAQERGPRAPGLTQRTT